MLLLGNLIFFRFLVAENANSPILVMESGSSKISIFVLVKADSPIVSKPSLNTIVLNLIP